MDEELRYDLTAPLTTLTFPVVESLLATALCWMAIGYVDREWNPQLHNLIVAVWALILVWRLVLPLVRRRRQRFALTTERIIVRGQGLRTREDSIPLHQVVGATKRRKGLYVDVAGMSRPLVFDGVPRAKKVTAEINQLVGRRW